MTAQTSPLISERDLSMSADLVEGEEKVDETAIIDKRVDELYK